MAKKQQRDEGDVLTLETPEATLPPPQGEYQAPGADAATAPVCPRTYIPRPCVGLPVQYHAVGGPLPGVLQRTSRVNPNLWDVLVFVQGGMIPRLYAGIAQSEDGRPGTWTFLPE